MRWERELNRQIFLEDLRIVIGTFLIFVLLSFGVFVYFLNTPINSELLHGVVIRNWVSPDYKRAEPILVFIQLDGGRTVSVSLAAGKQLPAEGDRVSVTRYINRFFGDSFGLIR